MSSNTFNGGPAFPVALKSGVHGASGLCGEEIPPNVTKTYGGMTLRDYFAAKAMQALIRELANTEQADEEMQKLGLVEGDFDRLVAKCSYDYADAMLKEREK